ncbi:unnamed protein product, partial [Ectocarpus sp. 8 AP-2014]
MLNEESTDVKNKVEEISIIIDFCRHQESLVIRAMAEVTTRRLTRTVELHWASGAQRMVPHRGVDGWGGTPSEWVISKIPRAD